LQEADLRGTKSMAEIVSRLQRSISDKTTLLGNGWDQNDCGVKKKYLKTGI
jgi:hypothetical protein